jgi:hypothetical protein
LQNIFLYFITLEVLAARLGRGALHLTVVRWVALLFKTLEKMSISTPYQKGTEIIFFFADKKI